MYRVGLTRVKLKATRCSEGRLAGPMFHRGTRCVARLLQNYTGRQTRQVGLLGNQNAKEHVAFFKGTEQSQAV